MPRILLIEDNPANLELMSYLLAAFGYTPQNATDGAAGLAAARETRFDLIICDVQMPALDGYEVARRLKADPTLRTIPLVAVTALAMVGDRKNVLAAGFDGYIAKPIDPEAFVRQVELFLPSETRTAAVSARGTSGATPPGALPGRTVLVVDDQPADLEVVRRTLEPLGCRVVAARGMAEGLAAARAVPCALILSDCRVPGGGEFGFLQAVRADPELAAVPLMVLGSTSADAQERTAELALVASRILSRPIQPGVLRAAVEACLQEAEGFARGDDPDRR